jgi:hypothetical protein
MPLVLQVTQAGVTVSAEGVSSDDLPQVEGEEGELSMRVASASVAHDNAFTRGGPTESKSEPLLHHGGQAVVRSHFVVESSGHPVLETLPLDANEPPSPLSPTKVKGRFLVTTTRDCKSEAGTQEKGSPTKATAPGQDDVTKYAATSASAAPNASPTHSLPSSANTDEGYNSIHKKQALSSVSRPTSSGSNGGTNSPTPPPTMFYIKDPLGRPVKVSLGKDNMFHMSRTGSFDILHSEETACLGKPRSASLCSSPPVYPPIRELALSGEGSSTNPMLTKPSIAHVFTQMSSASRDLTDIATQTSPCPPQLKNKQPEFFVRVS